MRWALLQNLMVSGLCLLRNSSKEKTSIARQKAMECLAFLLDFRVQFGDQSDIVYYL